ncbi:MAG: DoxX family protein [Planctomycetota bacterium]|nr:DoxX family protein [Planctomycetota bacterium]
MTAASEALPPTPLPATRERLKTAVLVLLRLALGAVLFYAGFLKLRSGYSFAETIANFRLMPAQANQILAVVLPWCEVCAGLLLFFGVWVRAGGLLATLFFATFTAAILSALARGLDIECGCFGTDAATRVGLRALVVDILWLLAALAVLWLQPAARDSET